MSAQVGYLGTSVADWVGALSSSDPLLRRLGAYALGEIGPAALEAVPDLAAALQDPVGFVRVWAAAALARVAPSGGELVAVPERAGGGRAGPGDARGEWRPAAGAQVRVSGVGRLAPSRNDPPSSNRVGPFGKAARPAGVFVRPCAGRAAARKQGEAVHSLQQAIQQGPIGARRGHTTEQLAAVSGALTLLVNLVMAWNTWPADEVRP